MGKQSRRWALRSSALVALLVAALVSPAVTAASGGDTLTGASVYTVRPDAGRIDVSVTLKLTNETPSKVDHKSCTETVVEYWGSFKYTYDCSQTTTYYYYFVDLWVEHGAAAVSVKADSGAAGIVRAESSANFDRYRVTFARTYYRQTRTLTVRYQIRGGAPRTSAATRVGAAYASFCVIARGDDSGSTTVVAPTAFDLAINSEGGTLSKNTDGAVSTYTTGSMSLPGAFWACLAGANASGYRQTAFVSPSGRAVELESWPEDTIWNTTIQGRIDQALVGLEGLLGRGLPTDKITIKEVASLENGAYAGTYDQITGSTLVTEDIDQVDTVAHELSHAWFSGLRFDGHWLIEGMAEWAGRSVAGNPCGNPGPVPGSGRPNLASWQIAGPRATAAELAAIRYQYDAACFVVSSIAERIGADRMPAVVAAMYDDKLAYEPDVTIPGHVGPTDWRAWLDTVDEIGLVPTGEKDLDFAQNLLAEFGVTKSPSDLAARSKARAAYHELVADLGGWSVPRAVLDPMSLWHFDEAMAAMVATSAPHDTVAKTAEILPEADALNGPVKSKLERAATIEDIQAATRLATDQQTAAGLVADAKTDLGKPRDALMTIGLLGTDLEPARAAAIAAVASADLPAARTQADLITRTMTASTQLGMLRVGIAVGSLILLLIVLLVTRRWRRTARRVAVPALIPMAQPVTLPEPEADPVRPSRWLQRLVPTDHEPSTRVGPSSPPRWPPSDDRI